jgi:capsular exopolysaccharide synthesis family protein
VRKRKWLIAGLALVVTSVVTLEAFRSKSIYQATTTVEIERPNRTVYRTGDVTIESGDIEYPFQTAITMKTNIRFLLSRPVLEDVVASLKLDQNPRFLDVTGRKSLVQSFQTVLSKFKSGGDDIAPAADVASEKFEPGEPEVRSAEESARLSPYVAVLGSRIDASPIEETRMLSISVNHTDPTLAAQIANVTAKTFLDRSHRSKSKNYTATSTWLDEQTRKLKARVEEAELALNEFATSKNMFQGGGADAKENLTVEKLSSMYGLALKAETEKILKGSLYEEVKAGRVDSLPESYADPKTSQLRSKLDELSLQATQYAGKYGPENPRVQDLNKQVAAIQKQLTEGRSTLESRLKAEYDRSVREEATLRDAFEKARGEAVAQNSAVIEYGLRKQKVELERGIYQEFLRKSTQAELQKQEQENTGRVIDPAFVPTVPVGPDRLRTIIIGLLASLVLGVGIALLLEYLDNSVKSVEDVARFAGLPTLAMIPAIGRRKAVKSPHKLKTRIPALLHHTEAPEDERPAQLPARIVRKLRGDHSVSGSSLAEAYRGLRTSILLSSAGHAPRTILFTSGQPAEGKTTTCINTAISLAQLGASVLIIDADMRRPSTHKAFKVSHLPGLSSFLSQGIELDGLIKELAIRDLSLLTSGPIPPNPAELISSSRMKELLQVATANFDHVLIDSPPLMTVSDPLVLSTIVEGVILVVQAGRSSRGIIRRSRIELDRVGSKIFGVVLNNVDVKREGYNEYDYYNRYTTEYEPDDESERANSSGD